MPISNELRQSTPARKDYKHVRIPYPVEEEVDFKIYRQSSSANSSSSTLGDSNISTAKQYNSDIYEGKSYLEQQYTTVVQKERRQGLSKEFDRLSVLESLKQGCEGRLTLEAATRREPLAPMIHYLKGWRLVDPQKAKELKAMVESGIKEGYKKFEGLIMYLPNSKIQEFLKMPPLSEQSEPKESKEF